MTAVYLTLQYYIEILIFFLAYEFFFGKLRQRIWLPMAGGIVFIAFWLMVGNTDMALARVVVHGLIILTMFFWPKVSLRTRFSSTIILVFVVNCVSELLQTLTEAIEKFTPGLDEVDDDAVKVVVYIVQLLLFAGITIFKSKLTKQTEKKIKARAGKSIIYGVIFMALAMLFAISGLEWARGQIENPKFHVLSIAISVCAYIGVALLGVFSMYMENTNKKLERVLENEKQIMNMQVRYYDTLLEREADTRKYRHDMSNHLICLEQLVKNKDINAVENYLNQMQIRMEEIQKRCISTGNEILDILTNHYVNALDERTRVNVSGTIQVKTDPMKLCTIYANLLQNAVEELKRCEGESTLQIIFKQGKEFFQISIRNSLSAEGLSKTEDELLKTGKKDKENHGIGINNVRKTVEELGGKLKLYREADMFCADTYLKTE